MRIRTLCCAAVALCLVVGSLPGQSPARWIVDVAPMLTLGESQADTNDMFSQVVGATRLPDGRVLVGDVGSYALRLFAADGKLVRRFGRKGGGPGEIGYLKNLLRCGDSLVTLDIDGQRTSVFSLGGDYVRSFRFTSPQPGRSPYRTACNSRGDLVHYGWENTSDMRGGAFRPMVPLWISRADDAAKAAIATIPGSERFGMVVDGKPRGSRPLPLGKQSTVAITSNRVYVATGERYEIAVYDFAGKALPPVGDGRPGVATTPADIADQKEREFALVEGPRRVRAEEAFDQLPFPKTIPTYSALIIDASGNLWALEYPRAGARDATWQVYDAGGRRIATTTLPKHLEVYEIGRDYVLGRYLDPDEAVPLVRLYRLTRGR